MTIYGAGLRISEIIALRVQDIDSKNMRLFIHHGKGGKDRYTLFSQENLAILREYWKERRPNHQEGYLFYTKQNKSKKMSSRAIQDANVGHLPWVAIWRSVRTVGVTIFLTTPVVTVIVLNVRRLRKSAGLTTKKTIF